MVAHDGRATLASVVLKLGVDSRRARTWLKRMVDEGLLELGTTPEGTLYFDAPGLAHLDAATLRESTAATTDPFREQLPRTPRGRALAVFAGLSLLVAFVCALLALLARPGWPTEPLGDIVLACLPGIVLATGWAVYQMLAPPAPRHIHVSPRVRVAAADDGEEDELEDFEIAGLDAVEAAE